MINGNNMNKNKRIPCILASIIILVVNSNAQDSERFNGTNQITTEGYSIFNETMVDMPWPQIANSIKDGAIVLLPVGVIEEHGPHICCGPDIYQAYLTAKVVRRELIEKGVSSLIAPPMYWGIADIANNFPGTFTISEITMKYLLNDIFISLSKWGVKNIVVFNAHGEPKHNEVLRQTILKSNQTSDVNIYFLIEAQQKEKYMASEYKDCIIPVKYKPEIKINSKFDNCHADCIETGNMAGFFPELVDTVLARALEPTDFRGRKEFKSPADVSQAWERDARNITPLGYFGDPASFDSRKSIINYLNNAKSEAEAIEKFFKNK